MKPTVATDVPGKPNCLHQFAIVLDSSVRLQKKQNDARAWGEIPTVAEVPGMEINAPTGQF